MDAAAALDEEGISCEVIDPRTLVPFDYETVVTFFAENWASDDRARG